MDKKKSQAITKSQTRTAKAPAKKAAGSALKTLPKTTKKISAASRTEKKKEIVTKASVPRSKTLTKEKQTPVSPAKTSVKKNVTSKTTLTARKKEIKKPLLPVKDTKAKQSSPPKGVKSISTKSATQAKKITGTSTKAAEKTAQKPPLPVTEKKKAAIKKVPISKTKTPEVKKTAQTKVSEKKSEKISTKILKNRQPSEKETGKTIKISKSLTPEKYQAKKTQAKIALAKTKTTPKKTLKAENKAEVSPEKVRKVVPENKKLKTVKKTKAVAKAEVKEEKKEKKRTVSRLKTAPKNEYTIKESPTKLKVDSRGKTALKPKEKSETLIATPRKAERKRRPASGLKTQEQGIVTNGKSAATYTGSAQAEKKPNKTALLKIFLPDENLPPEETHDTPAPKLPEEYGENELLLMEVDPSIVFVSWEIKPDDISGETGKLTLRVYDVTGMDFDGSHANRSFDIQLRNRVDSKFIDIKMSGRDVIMEIGILHPDGTFKAIKRSNQVSMPALQNLEEFGISVSFPDADTLIGY